MTALYGTWRSDRIAAVAQYAGADPWSARSCPVTFSYTRKVPLFLMRNYCRTRWFPAPPSSAWIETLQQARTGLSRTRA